MKHAGCNEALPKETAGSFRQRPPWRLVFMGTPMLAVPILERLLAHRRTGGWDMVGVVTQPDRRQGRKRRLISSPVKEVALRHDLPLLQPARFRRNPEAVERLAAWRPDLIVVMAFGQILPRSVLAIPARGCLNVHTSLLPALRGASPIATALLQGLNTTGVSVMLMDAGMDTGPVLAQAETSVRPQDTSQSLGHRLAAQGAELLISTLPAWLSDQIKPIPQAELPGTVSTCSLMRKDSGLIDWRMPARRIERMVRACHPWPGAHTYWQGRLFKILQARLGPSSPSEAPPGHAALGDAGLEIQTGDGTLLPIQVQMAGKKAMPVEEFLRGSGRALPGSIFDPRPGP